MVGWYNKAGTVWDEVRPYKLARQAVSSYIATTKGEDNIFRGEHQ
jgi:hypothetical protein